ncbi:MAG: DUF2182 domain-containing protein [Candidatus Dadabacteria bacterium]|nr:DUF2182 domain-containing protein [Candidatus Dadabacteria bacterium]NIQ16953.1 DUF2182 domain-containing protein [Candidatus Dadabacteria bacterium]
MESDVNKAEYLIKKDRIIIYSAIFLIILIAWAYLFQLENEMKTMDMSIINTMPSKEVWNFTTFLLMFVMWLVMMVAMMFPSIAPTALVFAKLYRKRKKEGKPFVQLTIFLSGYLVIWAVFSLGATILQLILQKIAFLSSMMEITSPLLGATILLGAGVFQFTSLKNKCLTECRNPMGFLVSEWRDGIYGAFLMGIRHGYFCVGCCWMLMALLFVTGVMNLMWVAAIALFVLIEKVLPYPQWTGRIAGILLILWGLMMLVRTSIF